MKTIQRLRTGYAALVSLYPKPYRDRFGESIAQTFTGLLRERAGAKRGVVIFAMWIYFETSLGIAKENLSYLAERSGPFARVAMFTALLLFLPLIAMQFTDEVNWALGDFLVAGVLLFSAGGAFAFVTRKARHSAYRYATGIAVFSGLALIWMNLAVGIIGNEENLANVMYAGVLAVAGIGSLVARFRPIGMYRALVATAVAQLLVSGIAFIAGWGAAILIDGVFAGLWICSARLFKQAGDSEALEHQEMA